MKRSRREVGPADVDRKVRPLVKVAVKQGWRVEIGRNQHLRFCPPDKDRRPVVVSATPSDRRAMLNARANLRRQGLEL